MSEPIAQWTLQRFGEELSQRRPIPGGGAVAAVTASHAAALGCMVLAYTVGKPKFAAVEAENQAALSSLQRSRVEALALADRDAAAYGRLSALWKLPPGDAQRAAQEPAALAEAIAAPMEILRLARAVLAALQPLPPRTNAALSSDLAIAARLADAAADAAACNVRINLPSMAPGPARDAIAAQLEGALVGCRDAARAIERTLDAATKAS
jgi:formiminotetrahydrofolate cyclodeaminase